ncbi:cysteine--tRNA ligase 2, cytoplasmic, partial [Tanacetum coccineum]
GRKLSDVEVQEKANADVEKGSAEVSTTGATKGTASEVPVVSTAEVNISTVGGTVTYRRRSKEKRTRKDKGKAIMTESEPKKKSKKDIEQERQWDEEERQSAMSEAKSTNHGPSDAMHNPPYPLKVSQQTLVSFLMEITCISIDFITPSAQDYISHSRQAKEQAQDLKSMITTSIHKLMIEVKDYELKTKIIKRADEHEYDPLELSAEFCQEFLTDMADLQCLPPTVQPCVSDHMDQIKNMIAKVPAFA